MYKVAVLLSTYNGERFIEDQINSILSQEGVQVSLYIRDDGSADKTIEIIRRLQSQAGSIFLTLGDNVGVGNSFMDLLYSLPESYDYYAFSDQDDIWENNKLLRAVNKLKESGAVLYGSNQECIDSNGKTLGLRYAKNKNVHISPLAIMSQNQIAGCTFVFPRELFKLLCERRPSRELLNKRIHDVWVAMSSAVVGDIYYDDESFIKYRQHENNVVGAKESTRLDSLKMQVGKIKDKSKRNGRSMLAQEIVSNYRDYVEDELLIKCADSKKLKNKIAIIRQSDEIIQFTKEHRCVFAMKVLLGLF